MKHLVPTSVLVLGLICAAPAARAGGAYISAGLGNGAGLSGSLDQNFDAKDTSSGRLSLGQRVGPVALEASLFGSDLVGQTRMVGVGGDYSTLSVGVDLKYYVGLVGPLELYGKGGLNKTWLQAPGNMRLNYDGRGWDLGGGLQFTIDLPVTMAAVWLDYTHQSTDLRDPARTRSLDGGLDMVSLGVSIGF